MNEATRAPPTGPIVNHSTKRKRGRPRLTPVKDATPPVKDATSPVKDATPPVKIAPEDLLYSHVENVPKEIVLIKSPTDNDRTKKPANREKVEKAFKCHQCLRKYVNCDLTGYMTKLACVKQSFPARFTNRRTERPNGNTDA